MKPRPTVVQDDDVVSIDRREHSADPMVAAGTALSRIWGRDVATLAADAALPPAAARHWT